jgi:hypothetical protein
LGGNKGGNKKLGSPRRLGPATTPVVPTHSHGQQACREPIDPNGEPLPKGAYALATPEGEIVSYKARWREPDDNGVQRQRSVP